MQADAVASKLVVSSLHSDANKLDLHPRPDPSHHQEYQPILSTDPTNKYQKMTLLGFD